MDGSALADAISRVIGTPRLDAIIALCIANSGISPHVSSGTYRAVYGGVELEIFPATAATLTYDTVSYSAEILGDVGNSITLVFDGVKTVQQVVNVWNAANPYNKVTFTGDVASRVSPASTKTLTGGVTGSVIMHSDTDPSVEPADEFKFTLGTGGSEVSVTINSTTGKAIIHAPHVELIRGAIEPLVLGDSFKTLYNNHTHSMGSITATTLASAGALVPCSGVAEGVTGYGFPTSDAYANMLSTINALVVDVNTLKSVGTPPSAMGAAHLSTLVKTS